MLVDCYYRSRSSNVVWGYLRPQTTAAALAVPHPSPFSLLLLLPRLSRRCSCSFHVARWRRLGGRRCHCCIRIQSRSSPHCCRRPSSLLPPRRHCSRSFSRSVPRRGAPRPPLSSSPRHRRYSRWWYDRGRSTNAAPAIPFPSSIASFVIVASRRAPAPPPRS